MSNPGYIRGFDGLRAVAVFLVFIMHQSHVLYEMHVGYYGVWLFFLLSGFLINSQLHAARVAIVSGESTPKRELLAFWRRRFLRIFPAYYVLLAVTLVLYLVAGKSVAGFGFHVFYLTNVYYEYLTPEFTSIFAHFWSLAVEEQFYLLFAPLTLFVFWLPMRMTLIALVVVSLVARLVLTLFGVDEMLVYIDSFVNFGVIALGGLTFLHRDALAKWINPAGTSGMSVLLFAAFLASIVAIDAIPADDVYLRQLAFLASILLSCAMLASILASPSGIFTALLEWRPLAFFGRLSYGFYLYHSYFPGDLPLKALTALGKRSPAIAALTDRIADPAHALLASVVQIGSITVSFILTLAITYLSWRLIEQPALRYRHARPPRGRADPNAPMVPKAA